MTSQKGKEVGTVGLSIGEPEQQPQPQSDEEQFCQMLNIESAVKDYKILGEMKGGAQGFIYIVENVKTHEQNILKSMFIEESKNGEFVKMVEMWKLLCISKERVYFVEYREHFFVGRRTMVVMEYCSEGDLDTLIKKRFFEEKRFTETEVLKLIIEGMSALNAMHSQNFIHRDIKSGNILIGADGKYKMSDFNNSKLLEGTKGASTFTGTLEFVPPEIVKTEEYSFPVDVYSFGVVLYQMMVGKTPFVNERGVNMMNIMTGKYDPISPNLGYAKPLIEIVHTCLSLDPSERPTPAEVLKNPFVARERDFVTLREQMLAAVAVAVKAETAEARKQAAEAKEEAAAARQQVAALAWELQILRQKADTVDRVEEELKKTQGLFDQLRRDVDSKQGGKGSAPAPVPSVITPAVVTPAVVTPAVVTPAVVTLPLPVTGTDIAVRYVSNALGGFTIGPNSLNVSFSHTNSRTLFFDHDILDSIIKCEIKVNYDISNYNFMVGAAAKDKAVSMLGDWLGGKSQSCSFFINNWYRKNYTGGVCVKMHDVSSPPNDSIIGIEIDMHNHTVCYFVNATKIPYGSNRLPNAALLIGITCYIKGMSYKFVSFRKLKAPTVSTVIPTFTSWI